jgi:hypothetical protein
MDRYATIAEQVRLTGRTEARGAHPATSLGPLAGFLFGLAAAGAGGLLIAGWLGVIQLESEGEPPPEWVLPAMGAMFIAVGLWLWGLGFAAWRQARAHAAREREFMGQRSRIDHDWDPKGDSPSRAAPALRQLWLAVVLTLFMAPFHMVFWQDGAPTWVKVVVAVLDLVVVVVWQSTITAFGHALKFGAARLEFRRFPYDPEQPIELNWWPPAGITQVDGGTFTLRCIHESWEEHGSGKNRTRRLVHEAVWQGSWTIEHPRTLAPGQPVVLRFEPPRGLPPTALSVARPTFWELEVTIQVPGLDYQAHHLVPVY